MVLFFGSCAACAPHDVQHDETMLHSQEVASPIFDVVSHPPLQEHPAASGSADKSEESTTASQTHKKDVQPLVPEREISKEPSASSLIDAKLGSPSGGSTGSAIPRRQWQNVRKWLLAVASCRRQRTIQRTL